MLNSFFRITLVTTSFLFIFQPEIRGESLVNNEVCEAVRSPIVIVKILISCQRFPYSTEL